MPYCLELSLIWVGVNESVRKTFELGATTLRTQRVHRVGINFLLAQIKFSYLFLCQSSLNHMVILSSILVLYYVCYLSGNWINYRQGKNSWHWYQLEWWWHMDVCWAWGACYCNPRPHQRFYFNLLLNLLLTLHI